MDIKKLNLEIEKLVFEKKLDQAFSKLNFLESQQQDHSFKHIIETLYSNYKTMLYYYFEGVNDPEQKKVYDLVRRQMLDLNDELNAHILQTNSYNYYYRAAESNQKQNIKNLVTEITDIYDKISLNELLESDSKKDQKNRYLNVKREKLAIEIFNHIFFSRKLTTEEYEYYNHLIDKNNILLREKCLIISALFLSSLFTFDFHKIQILLNKSIHADKTVSARSLVSIIILVQLYNERLQFYPQIKDQLSLLSENTYIKKIILKILIQLIRARDTERISKKMMEEIIPEMMKFSKIAGKKINLDDIIGETDFIDKNPEWKKELQESGIDKKLQEYSEMQSEGLDVFHSTFSTLKNFPFFNEISNWFLLFDKHYSLISELFPESAKDSLLNVAILDSPQMCNSDKYSLSLSIMQAPESHRKMMLNNLGAEAEQLKEIQKDKNLLNPLSTEETLSNQYIQDLYRFFKLNRKRNNFLDIFEISINFEKSNLLSFFIHGNEDLLQIANYCFDKNMYQEALNFFEILLNNGYNTSIVWQKKGYSLQMLNKQAEALQAYLRADLIEPDKIWILKRIAQLYRSQNNPEKAINYYERLSQLNPEDISIELNLGHYYFQVKDYEKALNCYYKVELLDKTTNKTKRAIAWISFVVNKIDIAEKYYSYLLQNKPTVQDYLNAGHVQIVQNNIKKALSYYEEAYKLLNNPDEFEKLLHEDSLILEEKGVDLDFIHFLNDKLQNMNNN